MEVKATTRHTRTSALKLRLPISEVKGKNAGQALTILKFMPVKAAGIIYKTLQSAIANAENNHDLDVDELVGAEAFVGNNLVMKRWPPRSRGRTGKILKPVSELTIVVREQEDAK